MGNLDIEMYMDEYSAFTGGKPPDPNAAVLAALFLEEAFGIRLDDGDITPERLGSVEAMKTLLGKKLRS